LAIPDLAAGALSEQMALKETGEFFIPGVFWIHRPDMSQKTQTITQWLAYDAHPLKRVMCVIEPTEKGEGNLYSWFHWRNQV